MAISSDCFHLCLLNIEQSCERLKYNNIISSSTSTTNRKDWRCSRKNQSFQRNSVRSCRIWKDWIDWYKHTLNLFHINARFVNWRFNRFNNTLTSKESFTWYEWRCFCENICLMKSSNVLHSNKRTSQRLYWLQIKIKIHRFRGN